MKALMLNLVEHSSFRSLALSLIGHKATAECISWATNPVGKKLPLSLACCPKQRHYSREMRGYAPTLQQGQQLCPTLAFLVTIQDPMILIATLNGWKQRRDIRYVVAPVLRVHVGPVVCHTLVSQLLCLTIDLTFTLSPHTPTDVSHRWEWWMDVYFIEHYMSLMGGNILSVAVKFLCPYFRWTGQ